MGETTSYAAVAHQLLADPAVSSGKLFGHPCLKIRGKVFVCEHDGDAIRAWTELADEAKAFVAESA